jgi:hypothetical protein
MIWSQQPPQSMMLLLLNAMNQLKRRTKTHKDTDNFLVIAVMDP